MRLNITLEGAIAAFLTYWRQVVGTLLILFLLTREWSWRSHTAAQRTQINGLQTDIDILRYRLQIEELVHFECEVAYDGNYTSPALPRIHRTQSAKEAVKQPISSIFNMNGCIILLLCCAAMLMEVFNTHNKLLSEGD
jgi:hypothetical protein